MIYYKADPLKEPPIIQRVATLEQLPMLYKNSDLVTTFHKVTPASSATSHQPSSVFQPKILDPVSNAYPASGTIEIDDTNADAISKISETDCRISNLESQLSHLHKGLQDLKHYSKREAQKQSKCLSQILALLDQDNTGDVPSNAELSVPSDQATPLDQMSLASGSTGTAGTGS